MSLLEEKGKKNLQFCSFLLNLKNVSGVGVPEGDRKGQDKLEFIISKHH